MLLRLFAEIVHVAIYVLLLLLPLSGVAAWFLSIPGADSAHVLLQQALLAAIILHVAGALFQHFVRRLRLFEYWSEYGPPDGYSLKGERLVPAG